MPQGKARTVCADVKPVLREVFRERDQFPPIPEKSSATDDEKQWLEKYNSECEKIWHHEGDLRQKFAKRISKNHDPNLYKLYGPEGKQDEERDGLIVRKDLMPSILHSATGNKSLWVQNILNKSSCDVIQKDKPVDTRMHQPLTTIGLDECSRQTYRFEININIQISS
ncbi:uncharacterized protein LOC134669889 [Cydia fagiglandana]|uniref:uncharacterized protein LOC134669889 n=1 Tax=Cydia fagiglandana TaxID=1458189 RepID=UPI002FEE0196